MSRQLMRSALAALGNPTFATQFAQVAVPVAASQALLRSFAQPSSARGFAAKTGGSDRDQAVAKELSREKMDRLDAEGPPIIEEDFKFVPQMYEQAQGDAKIEYEAIGEGFNPYEEEWLYRTDQGDSPSNPIEVPCYGDETSRIVGIQDPDDDCVVWWCDLQLGEPPRQIVELGEWYVLKHYAYRDQPEGGHAHH